MQIQTHQDGDLIIKYGDEGKEYFILSKGSVEVKVYQPKTNPDDEDLESYIIIKKEL